MPDDIGYGSDGRLKRRLEKLKLSDGDSGIEKLIRDFDNHIESGFQLATFQGPLCAEPVEGLAYFVESVEVDQVALEKEMGKISTSAPSIHFNFVFRRA